MPGATVGCGKIAPGILVCLENHCRSFRNGDQAQGRSPALTFAVSVNPLRQPSTAFASPAFRWITRKRDVLAASAPRLFIYRFAPAVVKFCSGKGHPHGAGE